MSAPFYFTSGLTIFYILVLGACLVSWAQYRIISANRTDGTVVNCVQNCAHLILSLFTSYLVASALLGRLLWVSLVPQGFHVDVFNDPFAIFRNSLEFMHTFHPQNVLVEEGLGVISWIFTLDTYILLACSLMVVLFFIWVTPLTAFYLVSSLWFTLKSACQHFVGKSCGCPRNRIESLINKEATVQ